MPVARFGVLVARRIQFQPFFLRLCHPHLEPRNPNLKNLIYINSPLPNPLYLYIDKTEETTSWHKPFYIKPKHVGTPTTAG